MKEWSIYQADIIRLTSVHTSNLHDSINLYYADQVDRMHSTLVWTSKLLAMYTVIYRHYNFLLVTYGFSPNTVSINGNLINRNQIVHFSIGAPSFVKPGTKQIYKEHL